MDKLPLRQQQQAGFPTNGATIVVFQPSKNSGARQPQFVFAGGVIAPPKGIYRLTPARPGELSSLGPRWTGHL
ncbi:unnamed protein product [Adineta steineri]|uniref:Uncharacterized protein n=1 Tax=Adineta steineri TaxID=433720 RepID=A0A819L060_9BILA|nr:unnamed protein product [Adineta steineri]CAF1424660.1 unnamed protein product [Adineta steineri]CAF3714428.1 unnamed protein product [Adineta steineri]CAF3953160.1 unnamed protein product [Adineta steineri]